MITYKFDFIDGHVIVQTTLGRYLIDTGSLDTFADDNRVTLAGKQFPASTWDSSIKSAIDTHVTSDISALVGMDILSEIDFRIDLARQEFLCSESCLDLDDGENLRLESQFGCPFVLGLSVRDISQGFLVDTGAKLCYLQPELIPPGPVETVGRDFWPADPAYSSFEIDIRRATFSTNNDEMRLKVTETIPPLQGLNILSSEILEHKVMTLSMRQRTLNLA